MNSTQEVPRETSQTGPGAAGTSSGQPAYSAPTGSRSPYYREESRYKSPALATLHRGRTPIGRNPKLR